LLAFSTIAFAGDAARIGTASGVQVQIPVGGRNFAMGGADLGATIGLDAIYFNPAGLSVIENRGEALFSSMSYIADINVNYFAVGFNSGRAGNIGVSVKTLSFGENMLTTIEDPDGKSGAVFSPTYATLGLTWAKRMTDRISFGITSKLIYESVPRASASSFAIDVGLQYRDLVGVEGLCLGIAVKNIGTDMEYSGAAFLNKGLQEGSKYSDFSGIPVASYGLPSSLEIGLSKVMTLGNNQLTVGSNFVSNNYENDNLIVGGEFKLMDMLFLRGGYRAMLSDADIDDVADPIFGLTFGAGLEYTLGGVNLGVDYTYRAAEYFDGNNVFCLKIAF